MSDFQKDSYFSGDLPDDPARFNKPEEHPVPITEVGISEEDRETLETIVEELQTKNPDLEHVASLVQSVLGSYS